MRDKIRFKYYSLSTENTYISWIKQYIIFNGKRHPAEIGAAEAEAFLTDLATRRHVSSSMQNQALSASEPIGLIIKLLYGTGMRLMEAMRLRVKDVELTRQEVIVRDGKGGKDRVTMLPHSLLEAMREQLASRREWHEQDIKLGKANVWLPDALAVKYPNAASEWGWQYVFAAKRYAIDPRSQTEYRHHIDEKQVQRYVKKAALTAGIAKPISPHTLRHSYWDNDDLYPCYK